MNFALRPYQINVIDTTLSTTKNTLIQIPTGGGKTVIAKEIIRSLIQDGVQVLFIAPKKVLMNQTVKEFKELNPHIIHGVNEYDKNHHLLISTNQTACRREINPDVIFIDEIHYGFDGKMIKSLLKDKTNIRLIGLSATPYDKNGKLLKGFGCIIDKYDIQYMIQNKYLVNLQSYQLVKIYNLDKVKVTGGDYNLNGLSKIVSDNQTILEIVNTTFDYIHEHKKAIVFAVDINHAELLTKAYQHEGFTAKALHSKMTTEEINNEIEQFKNGKIKILVSVLMLTTGFDVPDTDVVVIARPTKSQNLYKQMVGRVLRLAEGKTHAILLDCGNVIENLGFPLDPIKEKVVEEISNTDKCKKCRSKHISLRKIDDKYFWVCENCKHKKEIQQRIYKCRYCNTKYTHNGNFLINHNKLYLQCLKCNHDTLISEFCGDERFIQIQDTENYFLPFEKARKYVRELQLDVSWSKYVKKVQNEKIDFPDNIPLNPHVIYQNKGWINSADWCGIDKNKQKVDLSKYISFEDAKKYMKSLNFKNKKEFNKFKSSDDYPDFLPIEPYAIYSKMGWKNLNDYLGINDETSTRQNEKFLSMNKIACIVKTDLKTVMNCIKKLNIEQIDNKISNTNLQEIKQWINQIKKEKEKNIIDPLQRYVDSVSKEIPGIHKTVPKKKKSTEQVKQYLNFEEARTFVLKLKLKSRYEWRNYIKSHKLPTNIPQKPWLIYQNQGWININHWIGVD